MSRRHHRKLTLNRRQQFGPVFPGDSPPGGFSGSTGTTTPSDSTTGKSDPATGSTNSGGSGNNADSPDGLPIGAPKDPNPPSSTSTPASSPTSSNVIPSVDPAPPKGAQQQPVPASSSSSPPNVVSTSPVVPPGSSSVSSSINIASTSATAGGSSNVIVATPASSAAVVQTPVVLPSSSSLAFNPLSTPASVMHQPATTGSPTSSHTSSAASSSDGISTAAIVGIAAGGLCGLAVLGALFLWIGKRVSRYLETKDLEPPPMHDPIPDDDSASVTLSRRPSGPSSTPRPPTMIERKQANFAGRGNGFYNNGYAPQSGFPQYADSRFGNASPGVPPFASAPGQYYPNQAMNATPAPPYFNPIATPSPFDDSAAASMPGTPIYFSRQNSIQSGFTNAPNGDSQPQLPNPYDTPVARPNDGYATLNRGPGSVSPQQARQYSDLARHLDFSSPSSDRATSPSPSATGSYAPLMSNNNGVPTSPKSPSFKAIPRSPSVVNVSTGVHEGRATPVQFGFNDPSSPTVPAQVIAHTQPSQPVRPETIYDEEDAYAAI